MGTCCSKIHQLLLSRNRQYIIQSNEDRVIHVYAHMWQQCVHLASKETMKYPNYVEKGMVTSGAYELCGAHKLLVTCMYIWGHTSRLWYVARCAPCIYIMRARQ